MLALYTKFEDPYHAYQNYPRAIARFLSFDFLSTYDLVS